MSRSAESFQDAQRLELETNSRLSRGARLQLLISMTNIVEQIKGTAWRPRARKRRQR